MKKEKNKWKITGIISAVTTVILAIIGNVISHKIEDINYGELLKRLFINVYNYMVSIFEFKISIWMILLGIILILLSIKIYSLLKQNKVDNKENDIEMVNLEGLSKEEYRIIEKFYVPQLHKYTNRKKLVDADSSTINILIERGILKEQSDYEIIDNYTSNGIWYQLTDEAVKSLNMTMPQKSKK